MSERELRDLLGRVVPDAPAGDPVGLAAAGRRRRTRRRGALAGGAAAVAIGVVVVGAVGSGAPVADPDPATSTSPTAEEPTGPVEMRDGEVVVSCGGGRTWVPSVMADGLPGVLADDEARTAFQGVLDDPQLGGEAALTVLADGADAVEWRVLAADDVGLTIGTGSWTVDGPGRDAYVLDLVAEGDGYVGGGFGSCALLGPALAIDDAAWARVGPAVETGDGLDLAITENGCTGSRDPGPFLRDPVVVETDTSVTVYATSIPFEGEATCPGNPPGHREVVLDAPLGDRVVLDGSVYPPRPVGVRNDDPAYALNACPPLGEREPVTTVDLSDLVAVVECRLPEVDGTGSVPTTPDAYVDDAAVLSDAVTDTVLSGVPCQALSSTAPGSLVFVRSDGSAVELGGDQCDEVTVGGTRRLGREVSLAFRVALDRQRDRLAYQQTVDDIGCEGGPAGPARPGREEIASAVTFVTPSRSCSTQPLPRAGLARLRLAWRNATPTTAERAAECDYQATNPAGLILVTTDRGDALTVEANTCGGWTAYLDSGTYLLVAPAGPS